MNGITAKLRILIAICTVALIPLQLRAFVWQGLPPESKGLPVLMFQRGSELNVLFDQGLDREGRSFEVKTFNGLYWKPFFAFHTDSAAVVTSVLEFEGAIYVAGKFVRVKEAPKCIHIFRYKISSAEFESLTPNSQDQQKFRAISDLVLLDGKIIAAGTFSSINNVSADNLLSYDGSWVRSGINTGTGINGSITNLLVQNDSIFVSGLFTSIHGESSNFLGIWHDGNWTYFPKNDIRPLKGVGWKEQFIFLGAGIGNKPVLCKLEKEGLKPMQDGIKDVLILNDVVVFQGNIYACGLFKMDDTGNPESVIRFENGKWIAIPGGNWLANVKGLKVFRDNLFAYGGFSLEKFKISRVAIYRKDFAYVSGSVFFDKNENCVQDNRDEVLSDVLIEFNPGRFYTKPDIKGNYGMFLPSGSYTVRVIDRPYWTHSTCSQPAFEIRIEAGQIIDSINFARKYTGSVEDVNVTISSSGGWKARNGKRQTYVIRYENLGSEKINEGNITLHFSKKLRSGVSLPLNPDLSSDSSFTWRYRNLNPGEVRYIPLNFRIPEILEENELSFKVEIDQSPNETATDDNSSEITQSISTEDLDNYKQVFPAPDEGEQVAYMDPSLENEVVYSINFANFSSDTIHTVRVIDTIDVDLDLAYIQEMGASHNFLTEVVNGPVGSNYAIVIWTFSEIDLIPNPAREMDKIGYSGFISFKLNLRSGLPYGSEISNKARIVFNDQVSELTNEVLTILEKTASLAPLHANSQFAIYPNPAHDQIHIRSTTVQSERMNLKLYDLSGRTCLEREVEFLNGSVQLDIRDIPNGTYFLRGEGVRELFTGRFTLIR
ncbi:MAG: T9SS type A sorting domain-containing protein [Flavobacteriales bacterium]|nr:T9SS type A sorting domain-containing protein [Flavobacteriales bacterium]